MIIPTGYTNIIFQWVVENTSHVATTALGWDGQATSDEQAEVVFDLVDTHLVPITIDSVTYTGVVLERGSFEGPPITYEFGGANTGAVSGDTAPPQVCILARKRTESPGRTNRGRMFLPPPGHNQVGTNGGIDGAVVTAWQDALDALVAAIATDGDLPFAQPALFHTAAGDPTDITAIQVESRVATQRRRLERT